jgi:hypothetical protein
MGTNSKVQTTQEDYYTLRGRQKTEQDSSYRKSEILDYSDTSRGKIIRNFPLDVTDRLVLTG